MKRKTRVACALAVISLSVAPLAAAARKGKPSDVLEKAVAAMGGASAVDSVTTLEMSGTSKRFLPNGQDWSLTTVSYYSLPDRYRQEATLPMGGTLVTLVGPSGAFLQTGQSGGVQLPDEERIEITKSIRRNPIMLLQRRKTAKLTLQPDQVIAGKAARVIRFDEEIGPTTVALDAKSGDILQITYPTVAGMESAKAEMTISYSDYRPAGKLRFPYASTATVAGKPAFAFQAEKVAINGIIEERMFAPSAPEPAAAPPAPAAPATTTMTPAVAPPATTTTQPPKPPQEP